jgi:predicted SnoaL-like aldol condensation-catalyzing enzyme
VVLKEVLRERARYFSTGDSHDFHRTIEIEGEAVADILNKPMHLKFASLMALLAAPMLAQQPPVQANPTPGCSATAGQLEANKKVAMDFFRTMGPDRVALADPSYKQHNPVFKQRAEQNQVSDYEEFKSAFLRQPGAPGGQGGPQRQMMQGAPRPSLLEIVTAECDIVTIVHKMYRPDPAKEGQFYEFFTFDTFRVKNGKLVEHWDGSMLPMRRQPQQ